MSRNVLFPGREAYEGPTNGIFGLLHHEQLWESSHDVMERVEYVKESKPAHEVSIRLHNMIYLGGCEAAIKCDALYADYKAKRGTLYADYKAKLDTLYVDHEAKLDTLYADYEAKRDALSADYKAKRDVLEAEIRDYIFAHIPDCAWDGKTLFP